MAHMTPENQRTNRKDSKTEDTSTNSASKGKLKKNQQEGKKKIQRIINGNCRLIS